MRPTPHLAFHASSMSLDVSVVEAVFTDGFPQQSFGMQQSSGK